MHGYTRPGPERMHLQVYSWAPGSAPVVAFRDGPYWSDKAPGHVADGDCRIYLDVPDGSRVYAQVTASSYLGHRSASYVPATRSIQVTGWDHTGAALPGGFALTVEVYPEVS